MLGFITIGYLSHSAPIEQYFGTYIVKEVPVCESMSVYGIYAIYPPLQCQSPSGSVVRVSD